MKPKSPSEFSVDEVCLWLTAIGLGSKIEAFKENAIDGGMLVTLEDGDLTGDLGLSSLQVRKFYQALGFSTSLAATGGGSGDADQSARIAALEQENAKLKAKNADLQAVINVLQQDQPQAVSRAPAPAPRPPPPQEEYYQQEHRRGRPVVAGAAGGAARGAMLGAIGGAIAGDPGKGAKIGAAMGATSGGLGGLAARRRGRYDRW